MILSSKQPRTYRVRVSRRLFRTAGVSAVAMVALAGCGTDLHPGVAAIADDTTISQDSVDEVVEAICSVNTSQSDPTSENPPISTLQLRSFVVTQMITDKLTQAAVKDLGLTILPATVAAFAGPATDPPAGVDADEAAAFRQFNLERSEQQVAAITIGLNQKDPSVTTSAGAEKTATQSDLDAGSKYLSSYISKVDVDLSAQNGSWKDNAASLGSGSLSVGVSPGTKPLVADASTGLVPTIDMPPSQVCG